MVHRISRMRGASPPADPGPSWRLPVELLLQCLLSADMSSRIRASHVCRFWREAALAERRLWNRFSCRNFRNRHHQEVMLALLQVMLLRSRSLPFDLEIPHHYYGYDVEYRDRLLGLEAFDILRLAAFRGSTWLFDLLNPSRQPLPLLLCIQHDWDYHGCITMDDAFAPQCLPNLRHLIATKCWFPESGSPFLNLTSITATRADRSFFTRCPNLRQLEITDTDMGTPLSPPPPPPPSFETIIVRCHRPRALDFLQLMDGWRGHLVPRIIVHEVYSLHGVLPLFLASHTQPVELRLTTPDDAVTLAALPGYETVREYNAKTSWTIHPSAPWAADLLGSIERPASERLTSISVSFARLGALFRGQMHLPGLERIEVCLCGATQPECSDGAPFQPGEGTFLRAPRLRKVSFSIEADDPNSLGTQLTGIRSTLSVLHASFRALLIYDSELLDAICVSRQTERECADFAQFARSYNAVQWR